ncbi:MAG: outer membrane protein assembly factor BamD [Candidatus Omnitrophota bacterium]
MKIKSLIICIACLLSLTVAAQAFWLWTPGVNKLINPKYAVKDTPREQYDWAMSFFKEGDYKRAAEEFIRMVAAYKNSELAPDSQYYAALSFQKAGKYYLAFQNYQKVVKLYPYSKRIDEIIREEYELGEIFYNRSKAKLMGMEIMADVERGIEVFKAIIENVPYSPYADNAQFMIGLSYKKIQQYGDAVGAFQKLVQEYPTSALVEKAKYEIAQCMFLESRGSDYDQETTDEAIEEFRKYTDEITDPDLKKQAEESIVKLRENKAGSIYNAGHFYESQKQYKSAFIYYSEVAEKYGETSYGALAKDRLKAIKPRLEDDSGEKPKKKWILF